MDTAEGVGTDRGKEADTGRILLDGFQYPNIRAGQDIDRLFDVGLFHYALRQPEGFRAQVMMRETRCREVFRAQIPHFGFRPTESRGERRDRDPLPQCIHDQLALFVVAVRVLRRAERPAWVALPAPHHDS